MLMVIYMKVIGSHINPMDMVFIFIKMGLNMKENGLMINNMDKVIKIYNNYNYIYLYILIIGVETWGDGAKYEGQY